MKRREKKKRTRKNEKNREFRKQKTSNEKREAKNVSRMFFFFKVI